VDGLVEEDRARVELLVLNVLHKRNEVGVGDEVRLRLRELRLLVALVVIFFAPDRTRACSLASRRPSP
jgi:hypothetical protein